MTLPRPLRRLMRLMMNMMKRKMRKGASVSSREASSFPPACPVGFGFHSAQIGGQRSDDVVDATGDAPRR